MLNLRAPSNFKSSTMRLAVQEDGNADVCDIDLRAVNWTEPAGLVLIASTVEAAREAGRAVHVHRPHNEDQQRYLSRMGLADVLDQMGVDADLPSVIRRNTRGPNDLLELRRFDEEDRADKLAALLFELVEQDDPNLAPSLHDAVAEMAGNAATHSTKGHGFLAAQTTHGGEKVHFAVADSGVGVWQNLGAFGLENEGAALNAVLSPEGLSSREAGGGRGIPITRRLVTERQGELYLTSIGVTAKARADRLTQQTHSPIPGVLVAGSMACSPRRRVRGRG